MTNLAYTRLPYSKIALPKAAIFLAITVVLLRLASPTTANLSYLLLAVYALTGRPQVIQALFLSWLLTMFNPGLAPEVSLGAIGRYLIILCAALSVLMRIKITSGRINIKKPVYATLLLGVFFIVHSMLFSPIADVSILKSISFIIVFATLLSAWSSLSPEQHIQTEMFVFGSMIAVLIFSLPLIGGGVGYLRNGTGFQGILNHPQAMGPFAALLAAWFAGRFVGERKIPLWQIALLGLSFVAIIASEARTAGGAFVLGMGLPIFWLVVLKRRKLKNILPGLFAKRTLIVVWAGGIGLLVFSAVVFAQLDTYILKSGRSTGTNLTEAYEASRGALIERMLENINTYPITGIGFGIGSKPDEMIVVREPVTGFPLGASIEKGVMPVAIVEEMGIPGAGVVFLWIAMLIRRSSRGGFVPVVVTTTALFTNLGENMFFSAGGMGLLLMVLVSWAASSKNKMHHGAFRNG